MLSLIRRMITRTRPCLLLIIIVTVTVFVWAQLFNLPIWLQRTSPLKHATQRTSCPRVLLLGNSNVRALYFTLLRYMTNGTVMAVPDSRLHQKAACGNNAFCNSTIAAVEFYWNQDAFNNEVQTQFKRNFDVFIIMFGLMDVLNVADYVDKLESQLASLSLVVRSVISRGGDVMYITLPPICTHNLTMPHVTADVNAAIIDYNTRARNVLSDNGAIIIDYFAIVLNGTSVKTWLDRGCFGYDDFIHPNNDIQKSILLLPNSRTQSIVTTSTRCNNVHSSNNNQQIERKNFIVRTQMRSNLASS